MIWFVTRLKHMKRPAANPLNLVCHRLAFNHIHLRSGMSHAYAMKSLLQGCYIYILAGHMPKSITV